MDWNKVECVPDDFGPEDEISLTTLIKGFVKDIKETIPISEPITVLGRDLWMLVPILRELGYQIHYFIWSRLQGSGYRTWNGTYDIKNLDPETQKQWLKEVHPTSWVLDTGFVGSIFNAIRSIDPYINPIKMRLMSSQSTDYKVLGTNRSHNDVIDYIEHIEKISPRGLSYSVQENVVWARGDNEDSGMREMSVNSVKEKNFYILTDIGCSEKTAKEYATFTGSTPRERLGMSAEQRQIHYRIVSEARNKYHHKKTLGEIE